MFVAVSRHKYLFLAPNVAAGVAPVRFQKTFIDLTIRHKSLSRIVAAFSLHKHSRGSER